MSYRLGIFSLALFIFVSVAARSQTAMQPRVMIEAGPVVGTQTAMVDVRVVIPENRFIPAETKASLTGAWFQVLEPWITVQTPTYPIPDAIRLPAASMPILAYSGTVLVHMPVYVPAGIHGPNELVVRFGYELCDARSCTGPATVDAKATLDVQESRPDPNRLAYRVDSQRVAILTDMTAVRFTGYRALTALQQGQIPGPEAGLAKVTMVNAGITAMDLAVDVIGPEALATDSDWYYLTSFLPGLKSAGGTEQILRNTIGERVLGLPPEPRLDNGIPFSELRAKEKEALAS